MYMLNLLKYRDTAATGFGVDGMSGPNTLALPRYAKVSHCVLPRHK